MFERIASLLNDMRAPPAQRVNRRLLEVQRELESMADEETLGIAELIVDRNLPPHLVPDMAPVVKRKTDYLSIEYDPAFHLRQGKERMYTSHMTAGFVKSILADPAAQEAFVDFKYLIVTADFGEMYLSHL